MALPPCTIVLFGATGDLAMKKLIPALCALDRKGELDAQTRILAIGRQPLTDESLRKAYRQHLDRKDAACKRFTARLSYQRVVLDDPASFDALAQRLAGLHPNRLFYLAVPQTVVPSIVKELARTGIAKRDPDGTWHRVVFEKPFGSDIQSARALNGAIGKAFSEDQVFRIDHYLGKTFVQELLLLRFANPLFEYNWRREFIDNIQIVVTENAGVAGRGEYYDGAGAMRDMLQNHMMQLLALIAMEPPKSTRPEDIRDAKIRALQAVSLPHRWSLQRDVVTGQYGPGTIDGSRTQGYRAEDGVKPESHTETFVAAKLEIRNSRWRGVPFYLKTGKALDESGAKIAITFKSGPWLKFPNPEGRVDKNILGIRIQPNEGLRILINLADQTGKTVVTPHLIDFTHQAPVGVNTPGAYELLLSEAMDGDHTLFPRWDFIEQSWRVTDRLRLAIHDPISYLAGTAGPAEADGLLQREGREWVDLRGTVAHVTKVGERTSRKEIGSSKRPSSARRGHSRN